MGGWKESLSRQKRRGQFGSDCHLAERQGLALAACPEVRLQVVRERQEACGVASSKVRRLQVVTLL